MSEKKAPDNKREKEKERLIHVTEEQLQACLLYTSDAADEL